MPIAPDRIQDRPQKLAKSLKALPDDFSPKRVHQLRTRTRRMEAMVHALALDSRKNERRLLKAIQPVRKRAGRVRDMDVLADFASKLQVGRDRECSAQLLEHLGNQRQRQARKLQKVAAKQSSKIKKRLTRCGKLLNRAFKNQKDGLDSRKWSAEAAALALQLEAELRDWPALRRTNLHLFRLKVKELLYVLEMANESNTTFITTLGEVKDAVGEWHDWEELTGIAAKVIQHRGCGLVKQIRSTATSKFDHALAVANRMKNSLATVKRSNRKISSRVSARVDTSALASVTALAA